MRCLMIPSWNSTQLITLKVGSNIHFHANVESTVGMMNGSKMKARTKALPLKWRLTRSASHKPRANLNTVVRPVYQNVFQTAVRKMHSLKIFLNFFSAPKSPDPHTFASSTESSVPFRNG